MPMDQQQRAEHMKKLNAQPTRTDANKSKQIAKHVPRVVIMLRRQLQSLEARFLTVSGATALNRRTNFFDVISAETDGSLILHDIAQLLDSLYPIANDNRQPGEDILVTPFTDANVDYYDANAVSN